MTKNELKRVLEAICTLVEEFGGPPKQCEIAKEIPPEGTTARAFYDLREATDDLGRVIVEAIMGGESIDE